MTAKILHVAAHVRRSPEKRPVEPVEERDPVVREVVDLALAKWAKEFPEECWSDPSFVVHGGLF